MWHCLSAGGRLGIFKFTVCEDRILLASINVIDIPGLAGCISWEVALDMT